MVIAIIGENCSGKSTLAAEIQKVIGAETVTGKDYLRLAKSESEAKKAFGAKLANAVSGDNMIYVISEKEHIALLPDGAIRILCPRPSSRCSSAITAYSTRKNTI